MDNNSSPTPSSSSSTRRSNRGRGANGSDELTECAVVVSDFLKKNVPLVEPPKKPQKSSKCTTNPIDIGGGTATKPKPMATATPTTDTRNLRHRSTRSIGIGSIKKEDEDSTTTAEQRFDFQKGLKLEVQDEYGKWYSARVVDLDENAKKILIHFDYWSVRYDEWIEMDSKRLRPLVEQQKEDKDDVHKVGDYVLARWKMSKHHYPAKILTVINENRFNILFYDGIESIVRKKDLRPLAEEDKSKIDPSTFGRMESTEAMASAVIAKDPAMGETSSAEVSPFGTPTSSTNQRARSEIDADGGSPRKRARRAAIGVAVAVAQLTPFGRKKTSTDSTSASHESENPSALDRPGESIDPKTRDSIGGEIVESPPAKNESKESSTMIADEIGVQTESDKTTHGSMMEKLLAAADRLETTTDDGHRSETVADGRSKDTDESKTKETSDRSMPIEVADRMSMDENLERETSEQRQPLLSSPKDSESSRKSGRIPRPREIKIESESSTPAPNEERRLLGSKPFATKRGAPPSTSSSSKRKIKPVDVDPNAAYYRMRTFKPEWKEEFAWVGYDGRLMYCEYCRREFPDKKNGFIQGIESGFLIHRLANHDRTGDHAKAAQLCEGRGGGGKKRGSTSRPSQRTIVEARTPSIARETKVEQEKRKSLEDVGPGGETADGSGVAEEEADRVRRIFDFWRNGRESWLRLENTKFFCKACRIHSTIGEDGPQRFWSTGVPLNQASNIRRHGETAAHSAAIEYMRGLEKEGERCVTPGLPEESAVQQPIQRATSAASRKRKRSGESVASGASSGSRTTSTVTAIESPDSSSSNSSEKKLCDYQQQQQKEERPGSEQEGSTTRSSSLSHLADDDVVRCVCEAGGEDGLMLQCEQCTTWQHGECVGINEAEETPAEYICYVCKDPPGARPRMRYGYETEKQWLETGVLPRFSFSSATDTNTPAYIGRKRIVLSTNSAMRTVTILNDRLRAARNLIQKVNMLPPGPATMDRKAALKDEIVGLQGAVEKELDALEPLIQELEQKHYSGGRMGMAEMEFAQSKLAVASLVRDLDKLRRTGYFFQ